MAMKASLRADADSQKSLRSLAIKVIGLSRCIGLSRRTGFRPPRPTRTVKTINSSRWRGLKRISEHRLEPMEGVGCFFH